MKKLLLLLLIAPVIFVSCGQTPKNSSVNSNEIAEKRIFQKIDSDAYGMIKDLEISELIISLSILLLTLSALPSFSERQ